MTYAIDWSKPEVKAILFIVAIIFLVSVIVTIFFILYFKTYKKVLIQKNAQMTKIEEMMVDLFEKRVDILSAFDSKVRKMTTPNIYGDIASKVEFKKKLDKYISQKKCEQILMNNSAELAQIINLYNKEVKRYNHLISRLLIRSFAKKNGFLPREFFDESIDYNVNE